MEEDFFVPRESTQSSETMTQCCFCGYSFGLETGSERNSHFNRCMDASETSPSQKPIASGTKNALPTSPRSEDDDHLCPTCGKDLLTYTEERRLSHANRCANAMNGLEEDSLLKPRALIDKPAARRDKQVQPKPKPSSSTTANDLHPPPSSMEAGDPDYECVVCQKRLTGNLQSHINHLKNCAIKHNVSAQQIENLKSERQRRLQIEREAWFEAHPDYPREPSVESGPVLATAGTRHAAAPSNTRKATTTRRKSHLNNVAARADQTPAEAALEPFHPAHLFESTASDSSLDGIHPFIDSATRLASETIAEEEAFHLSESPPDDLHKNRHNNRSSHANYDSGSTHRPAKSSLPVVQATSIFASEVDNDDVDFMFSQVPRTKRPSSDIVQLETLPTSKRAKARNESDEESAHSPPNGARRSGTDSKENEGDDYLLLPLSERIKKRQKPAPEMPPIEPSPPASPRDPAPQLTPPKKTRVIEDVIDLTSPMPTAPQARRPPQYDEDELLAPLPFMSKVGLQNPTSSTENGSSDKNKPRNTSVAGTSTQTRAAESQIPSSRPSAAKTSASALPAMASAASSSNKTQSRAKPTTAAVEEEETQLRNAAQTHQPAAPVAASGAMDKFENELESALETFLQQKKAAADAYFATIGRIDGARSWKLRELAREHGVDIGEATRLMHLKLVTLEEDKNMLMPISSSQQSQQDGGEEDLWPPRETVAAVPSVVAKSSAIIASTTSTASARSSSAQQTSARPHQDSNNVTQMEALPVARSAPPQATGPVAPAPTIDAAKSTASSSSGNARPKTRTQPRRPDFESLSNEQIAEYARKCQLRTDLPRSDIISQLEAYWSHFNAPTYGNAPAAPPVVPEVARVAETSTLTRSNSTSSLGATSDAPATAAKKTRAKRTAKASSAAAPDATLPLPERIDQYIRSNVDLYSSILHYVTVNIVEMQALLKEAKIKCTRTELADYLKSRSVLWAKPTKTGPMTWRHF